MYKLGIDVGGTNTDAVLIDENLKVVAAVKNPTSGDIYEGIMGAVDAVLAQANIDRKLIKQATHMDRQPAVIYIIRPVTQQVK